MDVLILGGTAFLGRAIAQAALDAGHSVTCAARGMSGPAPSGASLLRVDRDLSDAYAPLTGTTWDCVIDVSWQPGQVRSALDALSAHARHWVYVSSVSVYADASVRGADESAPIVEPLSSDQAGIAEYAAAKVACELACLESQDGQVLIARAGLIGGPGDHSGRSGYWVARAARDPIGPMLVPADDGESSQVIDVRDLATWLVQAGVARVDGTLDAVGPMMPFRDWVDASRKIGRHRGDLVEAPATWLLDHGVAEYMGPDSMAMWLDESAGMAGWSRRSDAAAMATGLEHRSREQLLRDVLVWEREQGLARVRTAGLEPERERALIDALRTA